MLNAGKRKTGTPMPRWCDFEMAQTWWVAIWQKVSRALKYAWSLTQIEFHFQKFIIKKKTRNMRRIIYNIFNELFIRGRTLKGTEMPPNGVMIT